MAMEYVGRACRGLGRWLKEDGVAYARSFGNHLADFCPANATDKKELLICAYLTSYAMVSGLTTRLPRQLEAADGVLVCTVARHDPIEQPATQDPLNCTVTVRANNTCSLDCGRVDVETNDLLNRIRFTYNTKNATYPIRSNYFNVGSMQVVLEPRARPGQAVTKQHQFSECYRPSKVFGSCAWSVSSSSIGRGTPSHT